MAAHEGLYSAYLKKAKGTGQGLAMAGILCCLLACVGCSGSAENALVNKLAGPRIDWGESLLAGGGNGVGQYPAKFTFDITATPSCANDFVVYNTGSIGTGGVARVIAYNNLYATQGTTGGLCNADGPSVLWAYDTDAVDPSQALTSPILSLDGTKVAFIENSARTGSAVLRVLKWKGGQGSGMISPATPDHDISGTDWSTCPANSSCIETVAFSGGPLDSNSAPFYNYSADVLYVGDNSGGLHKFTGVFNGTPTEVIASWPVEVTSGAVLTSPVFDSTSGNIYVGDSFGNISDIREVGSTVGSCSPAPCVDNQQQIAGGAYVDAPVVDGTNEFVFMVNGTGAFGGILEEFTMDLNTFHYKNIGGGAGTILYHGAFDSAYLNSSKPNVAGNMYVCGKTNGQTDRPALYQIAFNTNGTFSGADSATPPALTALTTANGQACSPVTEVFNSGTSKDWIFFSVGNNVNPGVPIPAGSCATNGGGCVIGIDVTGGPSWPPATVTNTASVPANNAGATSGIIVDNVSTSSQASNIYFSLGGNSTGTGPGLPSCNTTAGVGCAVKLTQSTLQ